MPAVSLDSTAAEAELREQRQQPVVPAVRPDSRSNFGAAECIVSPQLQQLLWRSAKTDCAACGQRKAVYFKWTGSMRGAERQAS